MTPPASATASIGTGVGAVPLVLRTPATAGHTYNLPPLYVKNTGTLNSLYTVKVERLANGGDRTVPAAWVHVSPTTFQLGPGALRPIAVKLNVPAGAKAAFYTTDLVASTTTARAPGATALGAAAADKITFQIASTASFPWPAVALSGGVFALALAAWGSRRAGLHPRIRLSWRPT